MKSTRDNDWIGYDRFVTDSEWMIGIDAGHGGVIDGVYQTYPNKMYTHPDFIFYEGVFNRAVSLLLCDKLLSDNLSHYITNTSNLDVSLPTRTTRANNMHRIYSKKKHLVLSIHGNAAPKGKESARGIEVYTYKGDSPADSKATVLFKELEKMKWKMRKDMTDGDPDKESLFYILRYTIAPSVLVELGFYTNLEEAKQMLNPEVQEQFATCLYNAILDITKHTRYINYVPE